MEDVLSHSGEKVLLDKSVRQSRAAHICRCAGPESLGQLGRRSGAEARPAAKRLTRRNNVAEQNSEQISLLSPILVICDCGACSASPGLPLHQTQKPLCSSLANLPEVYGPSLRPKPPFIQNVVYF